MQQETIQVVRSLVILDDIFFHKMVESIPFCEEVLSTILGEAVKVLTSTPQASLKNLQGRSVILDALSDCSAQAQGLAGSVLCTASMEPSVNLQPKRSPLLFLNRRSPNGGFGVHASSDA